MHGNTGANILCDSSCSDTGDGLSCSDERKGNKKGVTSE